MINVDELKEMMDLIGESSIDEFEFKDANFHIYLRKAENREAFSSLQLSPATAILETACDLAAVSNAANVVGEELDSVTSSELRKIHSTWVGVFTSTVKIGD